MRAKLYCTVFITGASVMVIEILASRLVAPYFGNSIFVWTSIIGVIMASLSVGYWWGGRVADKEPNEKSLSRIIFYSSILTAVIPLLSTPILMLCMFFGLKLGSVFSAAVILSVPSVLLGSVSPYAVRLSASKVQTVGETAGSLYSVSTVGSIVGTFLTGFVLIPHFGVKTVFFILSMVLFLTSLNLSGKKFFSQLTIIFLITVFFSLYQTRSVDALLTVPGVIYQKDTPYNKIRVIEDEKQGTRSLILDLGTQGGIYLNSSESAYPYADFFHAAFALKKNSSNALFLGTGAGVGQASYLRRHPELFIDSVDIDPDVIKVAKKYFFLNESEHLRFHSEDARFFLSNSDKKYDFIVMDVFGSDHSTPPHIVTTEMFGEMRDHMVYDGVFVANVIGSTEGKHSVFIRAFMKTALSQFNCVYVLPLRGYNLSVIQNIILLAQDTPECLTRQGFKDALSEIPYDLGHVNWSDVEYVLVPGDVDYSSAPLLTDDYVPADYLNSYVTEEIVNRMIRK